MSTLTSASTLAQKWAAYDDNASYLEDQSITKAKAFCTSILFLLRVTPQEADQAGLGKVKLDTALLRAELSEARMWLSTVGALAPPGSATAGTVFGDTSGFRD